MHEAEICYAPYIPNYTPAPKNYEQALTFYEHDLIPLEIFQQYKPDDLPSNLEVVILLATMPVRKLQNAVETTKSVVLANFASVQERISQSNNTTAHENYIPRN